jgi:hypothetical protein|uniref:Uncharacterized protein n=1 Tax=Siphoviridae sp. ctmpG14 TaxID=2825654 RepID=A0A8S5PAE3_9CAUD|nr:MAG TPA: hypothetical protein [Siphoviridae sp. ctmpG14]
MAEEINESILFPIEENENVSKVQTIDVLQVVTKKWKNYFMTVFDQYRTESGREVRLKFFDSSSDFSRSPTLLSEDLEKKRKLLVGEELSVKRFNCGVLNFQHSSGKLTFRVQVFGYITGVTTDVIDKLELWQFTYDLVVDLKNFIAIKRANVYYDKKNEIIFGCLDTSLFTTNTKWIQAVMGTLKYKEPSSNDRVIMDNFTTCCILPIIRNALLEVFRPQKEEKQKENELSYHVNYGTW